MARVPHAAKTLLSQVQSKYKSASIETVGDADGFGVHRTVRFGKTESKWLAKVLPLIDDPRIVKITRGERVTVTFTPGTPADTRQPFPLDEADTVSAADTPSDTSA